MRPRVIGFWLMVLLSILGARHALASDCDPERIPLGKTTGEVTSRCGEPAWLTQIETGDYGE